MEPRAHDFLQPQRLDSWQIVGPGGGGTFYNAAISPHDPNLVFASTDMTECYVSENGGHTWRSFNLRGTCGFVFDPKLPGRVYALAAGLWRSDDRGHTWNLVYPDSTASVKYMDDEAEPYVRTAEGFLRSIQTVAVDPDDSNTLYANIEELLQVSHDSGKSWKILSSVARARQLWVDPSSPRQARVLYSRFNNTIGTWDGTRFTSRPIPNVENVSGISFGLLPGGKPVIYVAADYRVKSNQVEGGGIIATEDGGQTWRSLNDGILKLVAPGTYPNFTTIGTSAQHAEVLYASFTNYHPLRDEKSYYGVLKTADGGLTWTSVRQEAGVTAPNMHNDWTSSRWGPDWGDEPLSIGVSPINPDLVYTTDLSRIMRSTDGGRDWYGVFSQSTGQGYTTTGLDVTTAYGIHFDPFDPKHVFISYTDIGLMRSDDGGQSWVSATTGGVPRAWGNTTYWLEFDPAVKGKLWAAMCSHHDLPRFRELRRGGQGGVVVSVDGGHTWKVSNSGLPSNAQPTHILLDPKSPPTARVLYVAGFAQGVYKSTDGGTSWTLKSNGLPKEPLTWRMALDSEGTLYVVTIRRSQDGKFGNENDGWLFRSRNGGDSWERVELPQGVNGPDGITVDPQDPKRLYLSVWARYAAYESSFEVTDGGVYLSEDGGIHWQNVLSRSRRIYDVTVDPRDPNRVYAVGFEGSAWRSTDRGKTWTRIPGYNFKDGHRVIPDPTDIDKIYITTFGNSVWHGPAAGDPNAVEDIGSPQGMRFQSAAK